MGRGLEELGGLQCADWAGMSILDGGGVSWNTRGFWGRRRKVREQKQAELLVQLRNYRWVGIQEPENIVLWDSMAEASRKQFLASGELVLVADAEHWNSVSKRHMAMQGLGHVSKSIKIDEHGGVELHLPAVLHPAIVVGRLIGCWERAEGRAAKATWSVNSDGHRIKIESRREIAD